MADEAYTLTAQDILSNPNLQKDGALPGDTLSENGTKLNRVFSQEGDRREKGYVITQEDIDTYPALRRDGAEVGDELINNGTKLRKVKHDEIYQQVKYGWDSTLTPEASLGDIIESYFPSGRFDFDFSKSPIGFYYIPPNKAYGVKDFVFDATELPGWNEASPSQRQEMITKATEKKFANPEERREIILRARERELMQDYSPEMMKQDTGWITTGKVLKAFASPTIALPAGQTYRAAAGIGAGIGGSYSASEQFRTTGEVDPVETATMAGVGALGGVTVKFGVDKVTQKLANRTINKVDNAIAKKVDEGETVTEADVPKIIENLGLSQAKVDRAAQVAKRNPYVKVRPDSDDAVNTALRNDESKLRQVSKTADKILGSLKTRIYNVHSGIADRLGRFEADAAIRTNETLKLVEPFMAAMTRLQPAIKRDIDRLLFNGEFDLARNQLSRVSPEANEAFDVVIEVLEKIQKDYAKIGKEFDGIENYLPRSIKDYSKISKGLYTKERNKYAKIKGVSPSELSNDTTAKIVENVLSGRKVFEHNGKPVFAASKKDIGGPSGGRRTVGQISPDDMDLYNPSEVALTQYIRNAINDIEKNRFFYGELKNTGRGAGHNTDEDLRGGIADLLAPEIRNGTLKAEDQDLIQELLEARFVHGEKTVSSAVKVLRDLGYGGTIANPLSAITQIGDLGSAAALKGPVNTAIGLARSIVGKQRITLDDIGLAEEISREFSDPSKFASALNAGLKYSGFKRLDRLGKETLVNASLTKNMGLAKSKKGIAKLKEKYGQFFGDEFDDLVLDLKNKQITDRVKVMSFSDLTEFQPVTLSELPEAYLRGQKTRLLYMLKSFTLKQYDILRREVGQKLLTKGKRVEGVKNLAALTTYLAASNVTSSVIKDILQGREVDVESIPDRAIFGILGVYGINKYSTERYFSQGKVVEGLANIVAPPSNLIESLFELPQEMAKKDPNYEEAVARMIKPLPIVGKLAYQWIFGGMEKDAEKKFKESMRVDID